MLTVGALDGDAVFGKLDTDCLDGFDVTREVGALTGFVDGCMDEFGDIVGGGGLIASTADSYCAVQLGTEKHPS